MSETTKISNPEELATLRMNHKIMYYLNIAKATSELSTCLRKKYGSVIVRDDRILGTGYNGSARGAKHCTNCGSCKRHELGVKSGEHYEMCKSVHSEMNAIINAQQDVTGATLYLSGTDAQGNLIDAECCMMCKRVIINSGIDRVICGNADGSHRTITPSTWIESEEWV